VLITAILVLLFGEVPPLVHGSYAIHVRFAEAPGVATETPVRKSGITIGRVTDIRFADDDTAVIVTAKIYTSRRIYQDEACRISSSLIGIGGDTVLEIVPLPKSAAPRTPVADGAELRGLPSQDPMRVVADLKDDLKRTMSTVETAGQQLNTTLTRIDNLLGKNEDRISHIISSADETLQLLKKTLQNTDNIIGDPATQRQFREAIAKLPEVIAKATATADSLNSVLATVQRNSKNLEGLTEPLGERGPALVERLDQGTQKLSQAMDEMLRFSRTLNSPDSSLGKLANSPELYQHISRTAKNIDELTRKLRPILDDARVFSDKIARHPEVLGIKGAIQRNPGLKTMPRNDDAFAAPFGQ
jgi:phospholipid/cholesterol/gamma-HCH transport system substrate-binding protein